MMFVSDTGITYTRSKNKNDNTIWLKETLCQRIDSHSAPFNTVNIDESDNVAYGIKECIGKGVRLPIVSNSALHIVNYSK